MEASNGLSSWSVIISELNQGRDLAKQLQNHLDPSTPHETREFLIQKILTTYNKLLHMTNLPCKTSFPIDPSSSQINFHGGSASESQYSLSPCSDLDNGGRASKRRKSSKIVETVMVNSKEGGVEGNSSDGYSWRKYGQKVILGTIFPRGYYRCTHRHTRGCYATKQVQKSTEDPTLFHVIYKGHHTCSQPLHVIHPPTNPSPPPVQCGPNLQQEKQNHQTAQFVQPQLKVETFDIESLFSEFFGTSAGFDSVSPETSDSCHLAGGGNRVWTPESDVNYEQGWSGSDLAFGGFEFTLNELDIDLNFTFDDLVVDM